MILNEYYGFSAVPATSRIFNSSIPADETKQDVFAYNAVMSLVAFKQFFIAWYNAQNKEQERWSVDFTVTKPEILLVSGSGAVYKSFAAKYASTFSFQASAPATPPSAATPPPVTPPATKPPPVDTKPPPTTTKPPAAPAATSSSLSGSTMVILGVLGLAGLYMWWDK